MRIGIDATCWSNRRGYGRHLRSLFTVLREIDCTNEYVVFVDASVDKKTLPFSPGDLLEIPTRVPAAIAARADGRRSLRDLWLTSRVLSTADLDCLVFPTVYSYVPVSTKAVKVVMIHDVIAERLPQDIFPKRKGRMWWRLKSWLARMQADQLVTVSEFSRRMLAEQFNIPMKKIQVIGEAPDPVFQPNPNATLPQALADKGITPDHRLLTYVGGFGPHKNLLRLLEAFEGLAAEPRFEDVRLVLAGDYQSDPFHSAYSELSGRLQNSPVKSRVVFTGFVADAVLVELLNCSSVFVLPSLMEGFGLPAVEAAACGVPVVATIESPLPQLLGDGMVGVDPASVMDLREAIRRVLDDAVLRRRIVRKGIQAARSLSWRRAASQMLELLEKAGKAPLVHHRQPS